MMSATLRSLLLIAFLRVFISVNCQNNSASTTGANVTEIKEPQGDGTENEASEGDGTKNEASDGSGNEASEGNGNEASGEKWTENAATERPTGVNGEASDNNQIDEPQTNGTKNEASEGNGNEASGEKWTENAATERPTGVNGGGSHNNQIEDEDFEFDYPEGDIIFDPIEDEYWETDECVTEWKFVTVTKTIVYSAKEYIHNIFR